MDVLLQGAKDLFSIANSTTHLTVQASLRTSDKHGYRR